MKLIKHDSIKEHYIYIYFLPYDSVICDSITLIEKSRTEGLSVGSDRFVLLDKFVAVWGNCEYIVAPGRSRKAEIKGTRTVHGRTSYEIRHGYTDPSEIYTKLNRVERIHAHRVVYIIYRSIKDPFVSYDVPSTPPFFIHRRRETGGITFRI